MATFRDPSQRQMQIRWQEFYQSYDSTGWTSYGIFATVLSAVFAFVAPQFTGYITAVLLGFAAAMTGLVLKNKYVTAGGFITGIGCTIALFFTAVEFTPLFFTIASILNLIVPGIMMNKKAN